MTETATTTATAPKADEIAKPEEVKAKTEAQIKAEFDALPEAFRDAISKINGEIAEHNKQVDAIKVADAQDPKLIKGEIFEQSDNKKIARLRTEYDKLVDQAEKLRSQAYTIIDTDGLMPKDLTEEELTKLKSSVTDSTKYLRDQVGTLVGFEEMMPQFKDKLTSHVDEIKTRRGAAKTTGTTNAGDGPPRLRFKKIEINDVTQDDKGNKVFGMKDGEEKYTFTFASMYLRKQSSGINWTAKDLADAYLTGLDKDNLPDEHTFVMPYTYKDANGNEQTVNYKIKGIR